MANLITTLKIMATATLLSTLIGTPAFANKNQSTTSTPTQQAAAPLQNAPTMTQQHRIKLNSATAQELEENLLGIGAKKAQAIIDYRQQNGNFISVDQLTDVSGIGKATVEKNRHLLAL